LTIDFVPDLVREIDPIKDFSAYFKIKNILKKIKPDIVHTHSSKAGFIGRIAAQRAGVPIIIHTYHGFSFHDFQNPIKKKIYILAEKFASKQSTHLFAVSNANIKKGIKYKIFNKVSCNLTRDAIHIDKFKKETSKPEEVRKEFNLPINIKIVGMIGCFKPQKSPNDFINIAKQISNFRDDVKFILVGDGVLRNKLENLINNLNLEKIVILTGWRDDVPRLLKAFDVFVLTSLHEGLPMVIPQAMASGIPVVASKVDGANDIIRQGINGFLVKPKDIEDFCKKINSLLDNKEFADTISQNALSNVDEFDINKMVRTQSDFYEKIYQGYC